jgi:hypothetical protein
MRNLLTLLPALCFAKRCDRFDLQCFAEGSGANGAPAAAGTGTNGETDSGEAPAAEKSAGGRAKGQDAAAQGIPKGRDAENGAPCAEAFPSERDKTAEFEKLIRGEYKEQFAARTQRIIDQRFRQTKAEVAEACQESEQQAAQKQKAAKAICENWRRESEALKKVYPDFDFGSEAKAPAFAALLKAGVPVRTAYEACHMERLLGGAMQYTADKVSAAAAARLAERAARPAENGAKPRAGAVMRAGVGRMSREEREAIEQRVAHGEHIRI